MKPPVVSTWHVQSLLCAGVIGLTLGCASNPVRSPRPVVRAPQRAAVDERCRLAPVGGDTRLVATDDGRVVLIGAGLGIMQSTDGGMSFSSVAVPPDIRWPSIAADGPRVWVSWIERGNSQRAVVASVGVGVGAPIVALNSSQRLIDTEIVALGGGQLLLFVTEVDGQPNSNQATYTVVCLASTDGGLSWQKRSRAVTGPFGINIEDPRAIVGPDGTVLLAFEWETKEGGASKIMVQRSVDDGFSWHGASVLWEGDHPADIEPGGFIRAGPDLWFVASTDGENPGTSYSGAEIAMIRSSDGGTTWTGPRTLIREPDQISMGGVVIGGVAILPSVRGYVDSGERFLALYRVDVVGRWRVTCVRQGMFSAGFETGGAENWD